MKVALITDQHFGARGDSLLFLNYFEKFYDRIFFPEIEKRGIDTVVDLGDTFDRRKFVNYNTLKRAKEMWFDRLYQKNITLHCLVGNHTSYFKNHIQVNSCDLLLEDYSNVRVYNEPTEIELAKGHEVLMLPWICDENQKQTFELVNRSRADAIFGHLQIEGIEHSRGQWSHDGFSTKEFAAFKLVMSGHFHHKSTVGNIVYLGNPYEITWTDYNDPRGFHIYDTETMELEFIRNPFSMFHKIHYDDTNRKNVHDGHENLEKYRDTYVKIVIRNRADQMKFESLIDDLNRVGVAHLSVVDNLFDFDADGETDTIENLEDTLSVIRNAVDSLEINCKDDLNKLMSELYNEALNLEIA